MCRLYVQCLVTAVPLCYCLHLSLIPLKYVREVAFMKQHVPVCRENNYSASILFMLLLQSDSVYLKAFLWLQNTARSHKPSHRKIYWTWWTHSFASLWSIISYTAATGTGGEKVILIWQEDLGIWDISGATHHRVHNSNTIMRCFQALPQVRQVGFIPFLTGRSKAHYQFSPNSYLKGTAQAELPFEKLFKIIKPEIKIEK